MVAADARAPQDLVIRQRRRLVYGAGIACTALFAFPYFGLLNTKTAGLVLLAIVVSLVVAFIALLLMPRRAEAVPVVHYDAAVERATTETGAAGGTRP